MGGVCVHSHGPAQEGDAVGEAVGGGDHFAGEEGEHHRLEVQVELRNRSACPHNCLE